MARRDEESGALRTPSIPQFTSDKVHEGISQGETKGRNLIEQQQHNSSNVSVPGETDVKSGQPVQNRLKPTEAQCCHWDGKQNASDQ